MATVHSIRKEASPEHLSWRARIAAAEPAIIRTFLKWVTDLQAQVTETDISNALITRSAGIFDQVLRAVTFAPNLAPIAEHEAEREFDRIIDAGRNIGIGLSFDLHDPNFARAVQDHQAALVRDVTKETRRAIANIVERGYRSGTPTRDLAPLIKDTIGLTARQAQAVVTYAESQSRLGIRPDIVSDRAIRYSRRLRARRALTIARTETARAAVQGRLASYDQAAGRGLFDTSTAELEWGAVQDDPLEICAQLNGTRVPFGSTFDGLLPPAHPCCRCEVHLVLSANAADVARAARLHERTMALAAQYANR